MSGHYCLCCNRDMAWDNRNYEGWYCTVCKTESYSCPASGEAPEVVRCQHTHPDEAQRLYQVRALWFKIRMKLRDFNSSGEDTLFLHHKNITTENAPEVLGKIQSRRAELQKILQEYDAAIDFTKSQFAKDPEPKKKRLEVVE